LKKLSLVLSRLLIVTLLITGSQGCRKTAKDMRVDVTSISHRFNPQAKVYDLITTYQMPHTQMLKVMINQSKYFARANIDRINYSIIGSTPVTFLDLTILESLKGKFVDRDKITAIVTGGIVPIAAFTQTNEISDRLASLTQADIEEGYLRAQPYCEYEAKVDTEVLVCLNQFGENPYYPTGIFDIASLLQKEDNQYHHKTPEIDAYYSFEEVLEIVAYLKTL
jgi:hypothetical protein